LHHLYVDSAIVGVDENKWGKTHLKCNYIPFSLEII
jgi:hypothetical protein